MAEQAADSQLVAPDADRCGVCDEVIAEADKAQIVQKKLATGFCLTDSYAVRAFWQCCRTQNTEAQMESLKKDNVGLWKSTVIAFRDQRSHGRGTKFDVMKHLETVKKAYVQEGDNVFRPMLFSEYIRHYTSLPDPLTLSEGQATAQWHSDLQNAKVQKSEKRYWNPKSQQYEVAWVPLGCRVFRPCFDSVNLASKSKSIVMKWLMVPVSPTAQYDPYHSDITIHHSCHHHR